MGTLGTHNTGKRFALGSLYRRFFPRLMLFVLCPCILFVNSFIGNCFAQATVLEAPWTQKVLADAFSPNRSFPQIGNGNLWTFRRAFSAANDNAIFLASLGGGESKAVPFRLHGASRTWIDDVTVSPTRSILVAGAYIRADSSSESRFIAQLDLAGNTLSTVDLGPYEAERICAASDGTIWTFGQEWSAEAKGASYAMLRNYSVDGQILRSYLQRRDLPLPPFNLSTRFHQMGMRRGRTFLRCGDKSVGAYLAPARIWYEVNLSTGNGQSWPVVTHSNESGLAGRKPGSSGRIITGLALLGEHEVYASIAFVEKQEEFVPRGLYRLRLGPDANARWELVQGTRASDGIHSVARLVGRDGSSLVYVLAGSNSPDGLPLCCSRQYFDGHPPLFWSKPISGGND